MYNLPINLNNLTLYYEFEFEIPYQIKYLKLIDNIKLIDNLPNSIEELELIKYDNGFEIKNLINLPNGIKKLTVDCKKIDLIILPKSMEYLKIHENMLEKIKNISENLTIEYFD